MKSIIFMQGNPVHHGHMALCETALEQTDSLDIFLSSTRRHPKNLPYAIRRQSLEFALQNYDWAARVQILSEAVVAEGFRSIRAQLYDVLTMGSDIARSLVEPEPTWKPGEMDYFLSYKQLMVLQRPGALLSSAQEAELRQRVYELLVCQPKIERSSRDLRAAYRAGTDISNMMPKNVWSCIAPHAECFHNEM